MESAGVDWLGSGIGRGINKFKRPVKRRWWLEIGCETLQKILIKLGWTFFYANLALSLIFQFDYTTDLDQDAQRQTFDHD